ncbi:MAG: ABC transporter ATP-binding protein/permease [Lachnospiraceae bacterium]|nr:ABC transporter ATP-binding protein/permease [Lachnospiraceae bacterium]
MIKVNNLNKYYNKGRKNEQHVLNNINLEFENTGLVCILGESGSGKTTLLNTIGGLDDFADGTLQINDTILKSYKQKLIEPVRNNHFGYIFQNYYLLKDYSVNYNVKIALNRYNLSEKEKDKRTKYILDMLGIGKYKNKPVSKLSGGQQQRVSIARALVKAPDIILADEPTGNLDEENTLRTMAILKKISKECLVLLVTHEKRIARFFGDRIIEIRDGKIIRDEKNTTSSYERSDDSNIYLKEFELDSIEDSYSKFNIYHKNNEAPPTINMNMVWKDGKLYIQNIMEYDIIFEGEENGVQILDTERPGLEMDEVENLQYDLTRLPSKGNAKLPFHEVWHIAMSNIHLIGKKQVFITIILITAAIMLSITTAKFTNMVSINKEKIVSTDSHYVKADFNNISVFNHKDQLQVLEFAWKYLDNNIYGSTFFSPDSRLYIMGDGFKQIEALRQPINNICYVSSEHLKETSLIYGTMPKKRNEAVIDLQVIKNLMASKGIVSSNYKTPADFIGATLKTSKYSLKLIVTGISDNHEPSLYCSQNILLEFPQKSYKIASLNELKAEDSENYSNIKLADNEILIREGLFNSLKLNKNSEYTFGDDTKHIYNIAGTFSDGIGTDYVLSDRGCLNIRDIMIYEYKTCMIYTDNSRSAIEGLKGIKDASMGVFKINLTIPNKEEIKAYQKANKVDNKASSLITIVVVTISIIIVYFTIKSNAISRIEELTVYNLLGISKKSILKSYIIEITLLTSYTSLPAVIVTSGVIKFIGSIPSLGINMLFPWWSVLILLASIYIVHTIISIMPVYRILSKPPATLAVKG